MNVVEEMNFDLQGDDFEITGELDPRGRTVESNIRIFRIYFEKVETEAIVKTTEFDDRLREIQKTVEALCTTYGLFEAANIQMIGHWNKAPFK